MTINESIIKWLYEYGQIEIDERIDTDLLQAKANAYAVSKTPTTIKEEFIDGSSSNTEYYTFFMRKKSQFELDRKGNNAFLEELTDWVEERNADGNIPKLDNNRFCESISISSGFYLFETEESESVYQLTFEIIYRKEKSNRK